MTAMKLENSETAAMTAEPMAMPLVSALVVLPDGVEVGEDLAGALVAAGLRLLHLVLVVAHLADAVGVVGHRAEHVHGDGVAGQGQHADAGHGDAVGDEERRRAGVAAAPRGRWRTAMTRMVDDGATRSRPRSPG